MDVEKDQTRSYHNANETLVDLASKTYTYLYAFKYMWEAKESKHDSGGGLHILHT